MVKRFRKLSRQFAHPQSEIFDTMIAFFEWRGCSPFYKRASHLLNELLKNRKRKAAVIAIIRDIDKNHNKPTTVVLQSLFVTFEPEQKELILEKDVKKNL